MTLWNWKKAKLSSVKQKIHRNKIKIRQFLNFFLANLRTSLSPLKFGAKRKLSRFGALDTFNHLSCHKIPFYYNNLDRGPLRHYHMRMWQDGCLMVIWESHDQVRLERRVRTATINRLRSTSSSLKVIRNHQ